MSSTPRLKSDGRLASSYAVVPTQRTLWSSMLVLEPARMLLCEWLTAQTKVPNRCVHRMLGSLPSHELLMNEVECRGVLYAHVLAPSVKQTPAFGCCVRCT